LSPLQAAHPAPKAAGSADSESNKRRGYSPILRSIWIATSCLANENTFILSALVTQDSRPIYSIGAVARRLGVTQSTIRTWEERYGVVAPQRSAGGRRVYSREEVERLRFVKTKVDEGMQPADAHRLLTEQIEQGGRASEESSYESSRALILLIDRDPFAADLSEYFLRAAGYEVHVVLDKADAESKFAELSPRLAVLELVLPGGGGGDLVRRFKQGGAAVLAVSSLDARNTALAAGADAFLQKPLEPRELVSTVTDLLDSKGLNNVVAQP
jgi:DNA-binding transcriptional MerR regulator